MTIRTIGTAGGSVLLIAASSAYAWTQSTLQPDQYLIHSAIAAFACTIGLIVNMAAWSEIPQERVEVEEDDDDY